MLKKTILSITFMLFCLGAVGVRITELFFMINKKSGFYFSQYSLISVVLAIIAFVGCINFAIGAIIIKKKESNKYHIPTTSIILGVSSLLMSLGIFCDVGLSLLHTTEYGWTEYTVFGLSFISALVFAILGSCFFAGKRCPTILLLLPVFWSIGRLIINYTRFNGIAMTSENILDILTMAFFMAFWLYHVKFLSNQTTNKTLNKVLLFGSYTALLGLISSLPRFFVNVGLKSNSLLTSPTISFSNIAGAIYIICFLGVLFFRKEDKINKNISNDIDTEEIDEQSFNSSRPQFTVEVIEDFFPDENAH